MDQDLPVFSGILLLPPQGKLLIKKSWQQKFCVLYKASKFGIERLEIYDTVDDATASKNCSTRIITLENCVKIVQKSPTFITIITKTATYDFGTTTHASLREWLVALQSVAFRDDVSKISSIEEDNDLYCSSGEGIFHITLYPSEASQRCNLEPKPYMLVLTSTAIQLRNIDDDKLLFTWPYRYIRRYGYRSGKFTFEAGRKCESGEGTFHLLHSNQQEIFRCVATKMKSMKKLLSGESSPSLLDCVDHQFHAALSMEARSRSPLPPSPTTSTSIREIDSTNKSLNSFIEMSSESKSNRSFTGFTHIKSLKPRKPIQNIESSLSKKLEDYEPIDNYDKVEYRSDAWKTLGTDDVTHVEVVNDCDDLVECVPKIRPKAEIQMEPQTLPKASKIIQESPADLNENGDSYDRLNFFGSCSKLNVSKSGYKQLTAVTQVNHSNPQNNKNTSDDYDEVIPPIIESVRIADDSHLGYALIRKPPKEPPVDHQFHNDDPYAIISKPKQV
ncbi:docking protein 2 [Agrilus planipennis]|uniref:Docking protein 2 n=1 Tax=Agrilus planipennis TaxID=224129 RepID=A0A1W4WV36_AGRPL|nr:docking protein 2 [Agrilus planipennis]